MKGNPHEVPTTREDHRTRDISSYRCQKYVLLFLRDRSLLQRSYSVSGSMSRTSRMSGKRSLTAARIPVPIGAGPLYLCVCG